MNTFDYALLQAWVMHDYIFRIKQHFEQIKYVVLEE